MTTVSTMLCSIPSGVRARTTLVALLSLAALLVSTGCESADKLDAPQVIVSPYDSSQGEALWAVVPLVNESGVSEADSFMVSDKLVAAIDQSRGIACLPLNRTIAGLRAAGLNNLRTPQDARALAKVLGVDALVIGTITDYDPYNPPKLGMALMLFVNDRDEYTLTNADPMKLRQAYSDRQVAVNNANTSRPAATVSEHLDASNHDVLLQVKQYALGRHDKSSAMGWRQILASMDRYTEFAAYTVVSRLVDQERIRVALAGTPPAPAGSTPPQTRANADLTPSQR